MDSSPDLSLHLQRNSRNSRETSYMDFAQDIDSDIEENRPAPVPIANPDILASPPLAMDPPSPILPPPPGSISPPRFDNEDVRDEDDDDLPSHLYASELLVQPPRPAAKNSSLVEESAGEEEDEDEEDQQTIVQNKLKASELHGLDSLTSDMAATLQSMISEEIEEPLPRDPILSEEWSGNPVCSPPAPVWRKDEVETPAATAGDDEEDDESSGNSQSPQQVHKILSPPPPPTNLEDEDDQKEEQEEEEEAEKCSSVPPPVEEEVLPNPRDEEEPLSLPSFSSASLPPPIADYVPPPPPAAEEEVVVASPPPMEPVKSPSPPPVMASMVETREERELLRKLMDDEEDAELLKQFHTEEDELPLPERICGLAKDLQSPSQVREEKRESLVISDTERDLMKEESESEVEEEEEEEVEEVVEIRPQPEELPKYSERESQPPSLRNSLVVDEKEDKEVTVEEVSKPEVVVPPPKIQDMIPKTISIPEKIHSPTKDDVQATPVKPKTPEPIAEPEIVKEEVKPSAPVNIPSPIVEKPKSPTEASSQKVEAPIHTEDKKPIIEDKKPPPEVKGDEKITKITSPKGTRLDEFRKPYIPAYNSSLTSNKPPSYTSTVYTQPGQITAMNDRNRPVYMTEERRQRYSSPSSSLREQFFSSSTTTTTTSSGAAAPAKPPLTQTTMGAGTGAMSAEEQKSSTRVETSSSKTEVIRQSQQTIVTQQTTTTSSTNVQSTEPKRQDNRQSGQSQMSSRRSQEISEGAATSRGSGKQPSTPGSGDLEKALVVSQAENGGQDPQSGRLPDVSSVVKMANDIECQSTCSRVVKAGDACSLAFSAIYSKLIIVLGISLPLVEVISPHHIPVLAYQGFYLYLYGVSILFLLFMFFSLCCCGRKAPSSITPSSSGTSHLEERAAKASGKQAAKKAKKIDSPQTPQEELQKRLDDAAAAAAAAAQKQIDDVNGAGGDLNAATSTTNILTASPTAGPSGNVAEEKKASARKISHTFSDAGVSQFKYGSYFLRFGAILFGLASIVYSALEIGQFFECKHLILILTPSVRTVFILLQLYFIFLNNERITFYPFKLIARVGLMHLIGTNLALWINVLIHETNNEFSYSGQTQNITVWTQEALSGQIHFNLSGWNFEWQEMMADCPRTNLVGRLVQMASPYLFPCCIQYALICSVILYFMWRNVGRHPAAPVGVLQQHSSISCSFRIVDCRQSYKGLFLGILILASTIASVAAFFVLLANEEFKKLAFTQLTLCELGLYCVTLLAILIGSLRIRVLQYDGARRFHLDEYLLIGAQIGLFLYSTLAILGTEFNLEPETIFTWVTAILSILQTVCQTMFILDASRRSANSIEQSRYRPGREFVVFLLLANLALWIFSVFQKSRPSTNPVPLEFYGVWAWTVITHLWSPLAIFYRFHSTVCLVEISKRAYKMRPTFM